ncbi:hypothetical protein CBR_g22343 [Chara braunii]|uniref:DNA damage-binding protein 2 n=1 Tax=Chara braunii TaxID=69332 RepID=A0A388JUQ8_CHABU|nr:hypothetical protein CBR_g22343 [Chara braunii]|eukprot:GBG61546.1 hypothetical protein CBR_g22343 [Chara braunii]
MSTRRRVRAVVVEREGESDEESTSEEEEEEEEEEEQEEEGEEEEEQEQEEEDQRRRPQRTDPGRKPINIKLKSTKGCKVCKKTDHQAGFVGAVYKDCPNKPCFLCKRPGHTTATCPHRTAPEHGITPSSRRHTEAIVEFVAEREIRGSSCELKRPPVIPNEVQAAIVKLHSRRVTTMEFHPTRQNILLSGDKRGQLAIWDFETVHERTVYQSVHSCLLNTIRFSPDSDVSVFTASSDGTVCYTDLETGSAETLVDLNPNGWHGPSSWRMIYGLDVNNEKNFVLAADSFGDLHLIDKRSKKLINKQPIRIHKKGKKVCGIHVNPSHTDIMMSCGNDHSARIWDIRNLEGLEKCLAQLNHPRVVNSAYFSPRTGRKILTTCQDNRIRVWDYIYGDLSLPSREIVHSHDFNRHITNFRAEWDPRDHSECLTVVGRYISDVFDGVALHPIDFIDASTGQLVAELVDPNIATIIPVNKLHPELDILASGSSRSLFIWRPSASDDLEESENGKMKKSNASEVIIFNAEGEKKKKKNMSLKNCKSLGDDDDDDDCSDDDDDMPKKKLKACTKRK